MRAGASRIEAIRMMVRFSDKTGNLEVALQDRSGCETAPKTYLFSRPQDSPARGAWTEVRVPVCDLLRRASDNPCPSGTDGLERSVIRALIFGVERDTMNGLG